MSPSFTVPRGAGRHDTVTVDLTGCSRPPQPAVLNRCDIATLGDARAIHMRRALEAAVEHGTALLAALGLPGLVTADFAALNPVAIGDALDMAISQLDTLDAPEEDLEDDDDDCEAEDEHGTDLDGGEEDTGDLEPWLGAPEGCQFHTSGNRDLEADGELDRPWWQSQASGWNDGGLHV